MVREFDDLCPVYMGIGAVNKALEQTDVALCTGMLLPVVHKPDAVMVYVAHSCGRPEEVLHIRATNMLYDRFVAVSEEALEEIPEWRLIEDTIIVPNMIDSSRVAPTLNRLEAREALGVRKNELLIGYIGRLAPEKNMEVWFEIVTQLPEQVKGVIVGDGHSFEWLFDRARLADHRRFIFTGVRRDVGNLLLAFDRFLHTGVNETCCIAMGEAALAGVPIISPACGLARQHLGFSCLLPLTDGVLNPEECAKIILEDLHENRPSRVDIARRAVEEFHNSTLFGRDWTKLVCEAQK
jgi:glycosyltransferase involved in cell wall biosynthesis